MKKVTMKQRHQMARHQLPIAPLSWPMLATREKVIHMEIICGKQKRQHRVSTLYSYDIVLLVDMVL